MYSKKEYTLNLILETVAVILFILFILQVAAKGESLVKYGVASWYGGGEKLNAHTASGEVFNPDGKTCATWEWPIGTYLRVTNLENGCSVTVKVNDRGPAKCLERLLDLSRQAFSEIAELRKGLIRVEVETLDSGHGGS